MNPYPCSLNQLGHSPALLVLVRFGVPALLVDVILEHTPRIIEGIVDGGVHILVR